MAKELDSKYINGSGGSIRLISLSKKDRKKLGQWHMKDKFVVQWGAYVHDGEYISSSYCAHFFETLEEAYQCFLNWR